MDTCINCGGKPHPAHPDMCCTCMGIAFGPRDHQSEHEGPQYDADCPACLRGRSHTCLEHDNALARCLMASK